MAEFAKCHICRALMVDDPDDRREHLADHANTKRRIDALGRKNSDYLQEVAGLRSDVAGYGRQLEQHPISATPESISINEMPDDEIDEFADTITDPIAGEPTEDAADLDTIYPAIDREDDLDTRAANITGTYGTGALA